MVAFILVGACAEVGTDTKSIIARAEQGDAFAQMNLGIMYIESIGVPNDYKEAAKWLRKSAEQGLAQAQRILGVTYELGEGVPQDDVKAYAWYNMSGVMGMKVPQRKETVSPKQ